MAVELKIPQAGESITEVQIAAWRKAVGEHVDRDEVVVEIETDKAAMELPSPASGVITRLLKQNGDSARVGDVIAIIDPAADGRKAAPASAAVAPASSPAPQPAAAPASASPPAEPRVMPAARRILAEHGLSAKQVPASGPGGRLLKEDVERFVRAHPGHAPRPAEPASEAGAAPESSAAGPAERAEARGESAPHPAAPAAGDRQEEIVPMTLLRRRIAERLVESQHTAALLTTFNEIDMSAVVALRSERAEAFQKRYGVKLGFMSFFVKAAIDALKLIPQVNAEVRSIAGPDGRGVPHVVFKNYYDIGVAVSTERGLVVPVIRNAERLSFAEIEIAIGELAARARDRKLTVEELTGGTFTISNGGVFGSLLSTPIINPPQSGILGLHAIQERPVAMQGQVVIRPMMYVALTYDHRIVDGRESVTFLKRIKECVEDPTRMLLEV